MSAQNHRRSIRLPGYDYAQAGWYLVTLCTQGRACLFGRVIDDQMHLNPSGKMIQAAWTELPHRYPHVHVDVVVIMPNHTHAIIVPTPPHTVGANPRVRPPLTNTRRPPSLPEIVQRFKTLTTKRYIEGVTHSGWPPFAKRLWQRNYHEHIIRNERSLQRRRQYIADNPAQWPHDKQNPTNPTPPSRHPPPTMYGRTPVSARPPRIPNAHHHPGDHPPIQHPNHKTPRRRLRPRPFPIFPGTFPRPRASILVV